MRPDFSRGWLRLLLVVGAGLLGSAGFASAVLLSSSPATASTVIEGCENNATGLLRVVANNQTDCLKKLETPVSWNVQGPAGQIGPPGPPGPRGSTGPSGANGAPGITSVQTLTVGDSSCPAGGVRFFTSGGSYPFCNGTTGRDGSNVTSTVTTTNTVTTATTVENDVTVTTTVPVTTTVYVTTTAPETTTTTTPTCLHSTGYPFVDSITYTDCSPLDTYNATTANEAAEAVQAIHGGTITTFGCTTPAPPILVIGHAVELDTADGLAIDWEYDGPFAGHLSVTENTDGGGFCPGSADPQWH